MSDSMLVTVENVPEFSLITKDITSTHSSSIKITGLNENISYYVSLDNSVYLENNFYISNITSGDHIIRVRDSFGCEFVKEFTKSAGSELFVYYS